MLLERSLGGRRDDALGTKPLAALFSNRRENAGSAVQVSRDPLIVGRGRWTAFQPAGGLRGGRRDGGGRVGGQVLEQLQLRRRAIPAWRFDGGGEWLAQQLSGNLRKELAGGLITRRLLQTRRLTAAFTGLLRQLGRMRQHPVLDAAPERPATQHEAR